MTRPDKAIHQSLVTEFGLSQRDMETLHKIFQHYPDIGAVTLFGSRAKGNHNPGSDIDLAVMNTGLEATTIRRASSDCEESSLPYRVDLLDYHSITHPKLKDHIDRVGVPFYQKSVSKPITPP